MPQDRPDSPPQSPRRAEPPAQATVLALSVLLVLSTAFLFVSYCMARALIGGFGGSPGTVLLAVLATAGASIFLWWLAPLADFGEIAWIHLPADRRARTGRCPGCGYPHDGRNTCSECGGDTAPLPAWTLSMRPVRRFGGVLAGALVLAAVLGEAWCRLDESRFENEVAAARGAPYARNRAFPAGFARLSADASGACSSAPWTEPGRERAWRTSDPLRRERGLGWKDRADRASEDATAANPEPG